MRRNQHACHSDATDEQGIHGIYAGLNYASASAQLHNMTLVQLYSRLFTSVVNTPVGSFLSNLIEKLARRRDTGFAAGYEK